MRTERLIRLEVLRTKSPLPHGRPTPFPLPGLPESRRIV